MIEFESSSSWRSRCKERSESGQRLCSASTGRRSAASIVGVLIAEGRSEDRSVTLIDFVLLEAPPHATIHALHDLICAKALYHDLIRGLIIYLTSSLPDNTDETHETQSSGWEFSC